MEILESNDPEISVKEWKVTREQMYLFKLFWEAREILCSAISPWERDEDAGVDWVDWELQNVGRGWIEIEPYRFKNLDEHKIAVEIIESCLWQYNGMDNLGSSKVRSVSKTSYLQELLNQGEDNV